MVINDVTATVVQMNYKATFSIVEGLVAPSPAGMPIGELQHTANRDASCFSEEAGAAKWRTANVRVERVYCIQIALFQGPPCLVESCKNPLFTLISCFISKWIGE